MDDRSVHHTFFPYADDRTRAVLEAGRRFVYYTTAETAFRIISNREIWMRSTATMNDYREVEHGFDCLNAAYKSIAGGALQRAIDDCFPGLAEEVVGKFNLWLPAIRGETYIACVSEHHDDEDRNGRLSMWRAYGGSAGIALVIRPDVMFGNFGVELTASPIAYFEQPEIEAEMSRIAARIRKRSVDVQGMGREAVASVLFNMFRASVLCTKHPGFREEREWRVLSSPAMYGSAAVAPSMEIIRGVPQVVVKLGLTNKGSTATRKVPELVEILDRVIVGPCMYPHVVRRALFEALSACGVPDAGGRVVVSEIPLRDASI